MKRFIIIGFGLIFFSMPIMIKSKTCTYLQQCDHGGCSSSFSMLCNKPQDANCYSSEGICETWECLKTVCGMIVTD